MKDIRIVVGPRRLGQATIPRSMSAGSSRSLKKFQSSGDLPRRPEPKKEK